MKKAPSILLVLLAGLFAVGGSGVSARTVSVTEYNAIPNDGLSDHQAFANAFNTVVAAGGGKVLVPPGDYQFDSRITIDLLSTRVEWLGEGTGVSRLVCVNPRGVVWFANSNNDNELVIKDLSFMAGFPDPGTNLVGYGTAIQINNPSLCTNEAVCSLHMENVVLMPPDWSFHAYFNRTIYTSFLQHPEFINVLATGPYGPAAPIVPSESGFRINFGDSPSFADCYAKNKTTGYLLNNIQGTVIFDRCNAVGIDQGFVINAIGAENCSVENSNFHVNARISGVEVNNADSVLIRYGAPYWTPAEVAYTDLIINNCTGVEIAGNVFHVHYTDPPRTQIHLKGTTSGVVIRHNIFNAPGTRVEQDAGVSNVVITENIDNPTHVW